MDLVAQFQGIGGLTQVRQSLPLVCREAVAGAQAIEGRRGAIKAPRAGRAAIVLSAHDGVEEVVQ
jgi:hypothetical protein